MEISLGNIFSQNDKTIVSGGSSGIDVESLINGLVEARRQPAVVLEGDLEDVGAEADAIGELETLLQNFRSASRSLRNPSGVGNDGDNSFEFRNAHVSSSGNTPGSEFLSVTAEPGATITDYNIDIQQRASRNIFTTNTISVADLDTAVVGTTGTEPLQAGTLQLGPDGEPVVLEDGDSLNQVVAKINASSDLSSVEASTIKVADGEFRLSLRTLETGADQNYDPSSDPIFANTGFAVTQQAQDAIIDFDGTTIQRGSNSIDDIVDDVTFNLLQETPPGTDLNVDITPDREVTKESIISLVDAYNEFRLFASRQNETGTNGRPVEDAVLASNSTLSLVSGRINTELADIVEGITGGDPEQLADIGIEFDDFPGNEETPFTRNILTVDGDKLDNALASDFNAVRKVFEFDVASDDPNLQIFNRTNALGVSDFSLNIDQTNDIYEATYNDADGNPVTVELDATRISGAAGVTLSAPDDSELSGLQLIYGSNDDAAVNVTVTQGIGDRLFNSLNDVLKEGSGAIDVEQNALEDEQQRIEREISRIDEDVERFRERQLDKFSQLEAAISQANLLLQTLEAQADARNNA